MLVICLLVKKMFQRQQQESDNNRTNKFANRVKLTGDTLKMKTVNKKTTRLVQKISVDLKKTGFLLGLHLAKPVLDTFKSFLKSLIVIIIIYLSGYPQKSGNMCA